MKGQVLINLHSISTMVNGPLYSDEVKGKQVFTEYYDSNLDIKSEL